jgi:glycosyltransferase involved in cell wall biosynthesis
MTPSPRGVVIIPTYNEAENIARIIPAVLGAAPGLHLLVVDDASPDGTAGRARAAGRGDPRLHVMVRRRDRGHGRSYLAGFLWALARGYPRVVMMDADFSHDPADLPRLLAGSAAHGVTLGSRYAPGGRVEGWGLHRWLLSRIANSYARVLTGLPLWDLTGGFKCITREALERIGPASLRSAGYAFHVELACRAWRRGVRIREIPIVFTERRAGVSKMSLRIILEAMTRVFALRR